MEEAPEGLPGAPASLGVAVGWSDAWGSSSGGGGGIDRSSLCEGRGWGVRDAS